MWVSIIIFQKIKFEKNHAIYHLEHDLFTSATLNWNWIEVAKKSQNNNYDVMFKKIVILGVMRTAGGSASDDR